MIEGRGGFLFSWWVVLSLLLQVSGVRASGQPDGLVAAIEHLNTARGPEAYLAVREIWAEWAETDPRLVETALVQAAESPKLEPALREYAAFFAAHARTRRGDLAGARRLIDKLGFVADWLVVGPFDNEGKSGLEAIYGPEAQFAEPIVPGRAFSGKERAVRWRAAPGDSARRGWLNGSALFRPEQNICFYATTFISLQSARTALISVGTLGAFKLFANGELVMEDASYRGHDIDRHRARVKLPLGVSRLTAKLCGTQNAPILSLRVQDAESLDPISTSAAVPLGIEAAMNSGRSEVLPGASGALERFSAMAESKQARAAELESFARYLLVTEGDDPAIHQARDLARRAAESAPTVERLLLAGELAEDYNQHRVWLERAQGLGDTSPKSWLALQLAWASVEESGLNWRDAAPYYKRVLRRDPANLQALAGLVGLLNGAGLEHTALARLEKAIVRKPTSVTLLNMLSSQLRGLGYASRAAEVERRYAQFRFDDQNYLAQRLELALARNDRAAAEHWASRLLEVHPDSLWAHQQVAEAYDRTGQADRAIAARERALEFAPEDVRAIRALSDAHGRRGQYDEQMRLLQHILELKPQAVDVKSYVEFIEPEAPREDEARAIAADVFLKERDRPAKGESQRTLVDLTVKTVYENGLGSEFRQLVFQPLTGSAAALARNYIFRYEASNQRVQLRGAKVYRSDGSVDEAIETGVGAADDPSIAMYTSARTYNVQFPRLEAGDVVELRYRIEDVAARNELNDYFGDVHLFQSDEATFHAEYVLYAPKSRRLHFDVQRVPGLRHEQFVDGKRAVYRYWAEDLPPIVPEPAMPPWVESAGFLHVSTYADYAALGQWYWGLVQDQFDLDDETRALAHRLADGLPSEREKVAAVYNWVIKNTRYVALEFGIYGIKPRRCVQTVARGWGDCKDKATVIVSLLRELGIDSTMVLVRTQLRGHFKSKVASLAAFDHAIAYVPSLDLYLDGTAEHTGSGELPAMDQGAFALRINNGTPEVVTLPVMAAEENRRRRELRVKLRPDGGAHLDVSMLTKGVQAPHWRRRYSATSTRRERLAEHVASQFPGFALDSAPQAATVELDDFEQPVTAHVAGTAPTFARDESGDLSMMVGLPVRLTATYASLSTRHLDVSIDPFGEAVDVYQIDLPLGFKVKRLPTSVNSRSRFGSVQVDVQHEARSVTVTSRLRIDVTRVAAADYGEFKAFCQEVDRALAARLVIGK